MRVPHATVVAAAVGILGVAAMLATSGQPPAKADPSPVPPPGVEDAIKQIAKDYATWKRVSDQAHMAPQDCNIRRPAGALMSESTDDGTHGRKLYFLYLKQQPDAGSLNYDYATAFAPKKGQPAAQPVGQALVKQSFKAVEVDPKEVPNIRVEGQPGSREHPAEYLVDGGKAWKTGGPTGLFVMLKLDPATPGTDQGWVYATMEADGSKVIQAGRIASCMKCHEEAENDRLFGQPRARHDRKAAKLREKPAK